MSPSVKKEKRSYQQQCEDLMMHVVLPRVLPQEKSVDLHDDEIHLMAIMVKAVERMAKNLPKNTVGLFQRLMRVHQTRTGKCIAREINALKSGETFAMFIRRQNCAFLAHKAATGTGFIVATFPGNLHPKEVYGHQSDIEFTYPVQALNVPISKMLLSEEFADQLCFLYKDQPIEKKNRNYVHKWLMTILADEASTTADQFPKITKKIRDEVLGADKSNYFRRSSFYMCLKVFLQHSLTMELGHNRAKVLYKIVMLQFYNCTMDVFASSVFETLNIDLMAETMAKSARRIEKLEELMKGGEGAEFNHVHSATVDESKKTIAMIRLKIDEQLGKLQNDCENKAKLMPLVEFDFPADIYQGIPKLKEYLEKRGKETFSDYSQSGVRIEPQYYRHYMDQPHNPDVTKFGHSSDEVEVNFILSDFENWMLYNSSSTDTGFDSAFLRTLSYGYATCAEAFYKGDQVGTSKMVLVRLKLIAMLDAIAVKEHPLFTDHHTSIDTEIFEKLLLPQRTDMQIAFELEQYFNRRNKASGPGLISEKNVTQKSFTAKFAAQNANMQRVLRGILEMGEAEIEKKRQEWTTKRAEVERLRQEAKRKTHEYYTDRRGYSTHAGYCELCALETRISSIKMTQYERPLTDLVHERNGVVFELKAPIEIACLRDVLFNFAKFCHGQNYHSITITGNWVQYHQINCHNQSTSKYTSLGRTATAELRMYHVDSPFETFIIENVSDCTFHASSIPLGLTISVGFVKQSCTFILDDEYSCLQWSLTGTSHTQNAVIARQSECPQNIYLSEYKNFGSLRADGHRLQLRKLYAMIETEALSFEKTSVLSLIMQLLWEGGVSGADGSIRESFADFSDSIFAHEMIELLSKFSDQQSNNWVHPTKLLMTTFIAVRVFEINDDESVAERIVVLLEKIRSIGLKWIESIEKAINDIHTPDIKAEQELRLKLALVSITGAITFFVHSRHGHFSKIFTKHCHLVWSQFVITLNNNVLLNPSSSSLRMFLRMVRNIGIHNETTIRSMMQRNPKDIHEMVKKQWKRAESASFGSHYFYHSFPQVLVTEVTVEAKPNTVTLDIITGNFLVNNFPVARLPSQIAQSALFHRVFGNFIFEVQPDSNKSFCTVRRYNKCSYEFGWSGSEIIITEKRDRIEMELVPHGILNDEIPYLLVQNYSHFWNKTENTIEFRPQRFSDPNFSDESGIEYKLDLNVRLLTHIKTKRHMLDINKVSYKKIVNQLSRLETPKFIHILMDKPQIAKVELVRMRLKFKVDCTTPEQSYDLLSNEFSQMRVSCQQNIGTLYGLQHGLLLESVPVEGAHLPVTRILILPHGKIHSTVANNHVSVGIDLDSGLLSPPFHRYEIDEFCRQVKASSSNYSAWFYLAYLHSATSHGEVEPFLKMSGTERALQILQSGFAWSSAPYDTEASNMLKMIIDLSPKRKVKECFQTVEWPTFIQPYAAQDSFVFIAKKLLEDSFRLEGLHRTPGQQQLKIDSQLEHNKRQYLRCLPLRPNLRASDEFLYHEILRTTPVETISSRKCPHTQTVSILYHRSAYKRPSDLDLKSFLKSGKALDGVVNKPVIPDLLNHELYQSFVNLWISLYDYARGKLLSYEQFALIWSLLAHEEKPLPPILALQSVLMDPHAFRAIDPPPMPMFHIGEGTYSAARVSKMLENCHSNPYDYDHKDFDTDAYNRRKSNAIDTMTRSVTSRWPCDEISLDFSFDNFNLSQASRKISSFLKIWNDNRKLDIFIQSVQNALNSLTRSTYVNVPHFGLYSNSLTLNWPKHENDWTNKMHERLYEFKAEILEAEGIWNHQMKGCKSVTEWWNIFERIVNGPNAQHLIDAGIYPRVVPSLVLPKITDRKESSPLKKVIGALAIATVLEQRETRIQIYSQRPELRAALERETEHEPHVNWNPCDYPEWLLFEIEQNLMIRRIQIEIAKRMINPPDIGTKHSVMQLNMGEGKTAVIVPILASVIADGKQTCQITVLKSLFATNLKSLRRYLGGMLNRKVYVFPCRRDMPIGQYAKWISDIYEECMLMKGVILTLPEYRLSFQLKIYESVKKSCLQEAAQFLATHKWINRNVRSILDESDAILHPKYQLIYTVGNQQQLDGGAYRWLVMQSLLKRVPHHMRALSERHGQENIEFDDNYVQNEHVFGSPSVKHRPDVFTPCRILNERVYDELKKVLIEDFLDGRLNTAFPEITAESKRNLRHLLIERNIDRVTFDATIADFSISERNTIMILSGLLRFEVLKLVLMRRWRVNYGVNQFGQRKMAIPFKAKDVAAEMTEFGHPDVAIGFTHLSYYYSGLTDCQLKQTFKILSVSQNPASIYEQWVQSVQPELVDASIRTYTGVNLSDPHQRDALLFPVFRFNMHVVDFWLSTVVFPREAKTFEKKLMCTAWDLCTEHMDHPVTGFSGTNDTKNILPMPIAQNDLDELEDTNEKVRQILLRQSYHHLPANVSGKAIVEELAQEGIPVLLDAGALMLELNNKEVAEKWLELTSDQRFDAAIYFDRNDVLQTIDRNGIVTELDCSVYRDNLSRCLVYLDDVHTRGTDLKFPLQWKACVTLSGNITRDKTVQASMRMRQLGKGQSIVFWASNEAHVRIRGIARMPYVTTEDVVQFICSNSQSFETENTVHWATGAYNYTQKLIGHKLHDASSEQNSLQDLYAIVADDEFVTLEEMYGDKEEARLTDIARNKFDNLVEMHRNGEQSVSSFAERIKNEVNEKICKHASNVRRFIKSLDEEQEKELEHELEEERLVERPPPMSPATPNFDKKLLELVLSTQSEPILADLQQRNVLHSMFNSLSNTHLIQEYANEAAAWADHLFVTDDFLRVLSQPSRSCDEYLRPVWWIGQIKVKFNKSIVVLFSSFECDRLKSAFSTSKTSVLYMYRPKISKFHSKLLQERKLQITGIESAAAVSLPDRVQIDMYSGAMYFDDDEEQDAYCNFLGLIPRPRTQDQNSAFEHGFIKPNGFVPIEHRKCSPAISDAVSSCKFNSNPVDLAIKIVQAHHYSLHEDSHVASILKRGTKLRILRKRPHE